ncbi:hypothetical protein [Actinomadura sp. DC4]|uniref:hypothetical protein n=1 Tax=Actinomadura sp. DC4 TaxID=3055069 RepID=UPI0025AFC0CC|nr:hypothetical protein [Actinomadura sp. DC4]MDN3351946.1 hypothetical protein [Actinomadura sp. DC4]
MARSSACVEARTGHIVNGVFVGAPSAPVFTAPVPARVSVTSVVSDETVGSLEEFDNRHPFRPRDGAGAGDIVDDWAALSRLPYRRRSPALRAVDSALDRWKKGGRLTLHVLGRNERELKDLARAIDRWRETKNGGSARSAAMDRLEREIRDELAHVAEERRRMDAAEPAPDTDAQVTPDEFADWLRWSSALGLDHARAAEPSGSRQIELLANAVDDGSLGGLAAMTAGLTPEAIDAELTRLTAAKTPFDLFGFLRLPRTYLTPGYDPLTLAMVVAHAREQPTDARSQRDLLEIAGKWLGWRAQFLAAGDQRSRAVELVDQVRNRPAVLSAIVHAQAEDPIGLALDMGVRFSDVRALSDEVGDLVARGEGRAAADLIAGIEHDTFSLLALADIYLVTTEGDLFADVPGLADRVRTVPAEPATVAQVQGRPLNADSHLSYDVGQLERAVWGIADHQEADIDFLIAIDPLRLKDGFPLDWVLGHVWIEIRLPLGRDAGGRPRYGRTFSVGFMTNDYIDYTRAQRGGLSSPDTDHVAAASVSRVITPQELRAAIVFVRATQNRPWVWFASNCVTFANELSGAVFGGRRPFSGLAARIPRSPRRLRVPRPPFPDTVTPPPSAHVIRVGDLRDELQVMDTVASFAALYTGHLIRNLRVGLPAPPVQIAVSSPPRALLVRSSRAMSLNRANDLQDYFQRAVRRLLTDRFPATAKQIVYGEIPIRLVPLGEVKDPSGEPRWEASFELFAPLEDVAILSAATVHSSRASSSESIGWSASADGATGRTHWPNDPLGRTLAGHDANLSRSTIDTSDELDWHESRYSLPTGPDGVKACVSVAVVDAR